MSAEKVQAGKRIIEELAGKAFDEIELDEAKKLLLACGMISKNWREDTPVIRLLGCPISDMLHSGTILTMGRHREH